MYKNVVAVYLVRNLKKIVYAKIHHTTNLKQADMKDNASDMIPNFNL